MARLSALPLEVNDAQKEALEAIVRKRASPQQQVLRARIVLLASAGVAAHETMRRLGGCTHDCTDLAPALVRIGLRERVGTFGRSPTLGDAANLFPGAGLRDYRHCL
jgi:hypothetical protein